LLNGLAASRGKIYSSLRGETTFYLGRSNKMSINAAPGEIIHAISGDRPLVSLGRPAAGLDTKLLNPRTALGISQDGKRLILMVVDGRQTGYSEGVNFVELSTLLIYYGCHTAMNLDGGGSSAMIVEGPDKKPVVLNSPIDSGVVGQERAVANHLGIFVKK
jgi:exopolysaccharide biosynthesis protein